MTGGGGARNHYGLTKGPHKGMKMAAVPRHSGLEPESRGRGRGFPPARETPWPCEGHIRSMKKAVASHGTGVRAGFKPAPTS